MTNDHVKMVAKLQHFYDLMMTRLSDIEARCMECLDGEVQEVGKQVHEEMNELSKEYTEIFGDFLYVDPHEKR